jgi:hypothetical protein
MITTATEEDLLIVLAEEKQHVTGGPIHDGTGIPTRTLTIADDGNRG